MSVSVINSAYSLDPATVSAPGAGSNRLAFYTVYSFDVTNGQYLATALSVGGQTGVLVASSQPASPYREGVAAACFVFTEAKIAAMSNAVLTPTWGDVDGEPDSEIYHMVCLAAAHQSSSYGTPITNSSDTLVTDWDPGDVNGVVDGYILGLLGMGGGTDILFNNLDDLLVTSGNGGEAVTGTSATTGGIATSSSSAVDMVITAPNNRPHVFIGFVVNPAADSGTIHNRTLPNNFIMLFDGSPINA